MTKAAALAGLLGAVMMVTGCASYVKTFDGGDNMLGACRSGTHLAGIPFLPFGQAGCGGFVSSRQQAEPFRFPREEDAYQRTAPKKVQKRRVGDESSGWTD